MQYKLSSDLCYKLTDVSVPVQMANELFSNIIPFLQYLFRTSRSKKELSLNLWLWLFKQSPK